MIINHNMLAINTHRQLGVTGTNQKKSMEKLSSGMRINRAGDDAAGLSISEKMRGQIRGLKQASRNAQDGISLIQTAEGALSSVNEMLTRVKELATQAANGTYDADDDLTRCQEEVDELAKQIKDIQDNTKFNGIALLGDGASGGVNDAFEKSSETFLGVNSSNVMKKGTDVIAVEVNSKWYKAEDVEEDSGALKLKEADAPEITFEEYQEVDGELYKKDTKDVEINSHTFSSQEVLVDDENKIVAVKAADNKYYKIDEVKDDTTSGHAIAKKTSGTTQLTLTTKFKMQRSSSDSENSISLQIGHESSQKLDLDKSKFNLAEVTSAVEGYDLKTQEGARTCLEDIEKQINKVSASRSYLGANQNRLEYTIRNLDTSSENLQAAESRIRDVDMAQEMMSLTKQNILRQAAQSMLAQANQAPQGVLQLLR